jgi:hypothetical protein
MNRRVIDWLTGVLRDDHRDLEVHFHSGPESTPAVCYDERCGMPRLDVHTA